jgi:hypothetical protein
MIRDDKSPFMIYTGSLGLDLPVDIYREHDVGVAPKAQNESQ